MALTVYTNIYSAIAQNNLTKANDSLSKSIERLSSGMRINHASDDASGLAISEKLRGQIRGMAKASMNAQDAISFLQTAEGGMEVIGDIVQRMRELAVQAGNGAYTSNDRMELQKEVTQLKDEINRISSSTEFNTKKILTGESAALWSTSDPSSIEAIVRGAPAEGNYRLSIEATGGQNAVYKTDIMNTGDTSKTVDTYGYNFVYQGGVTEASFSNMYGEVTEPFNVLVTSSTAALTAVASGVLTLDKYVGKLATGEESTLDVSLTVNDAASGNAYYVLEAVNDGNFDDGPASTNDFKLTKYDAKTGARTEINLGVADVSGGTTWAASTGAGTNVSFDFNNVSKFAAGDTIVFGARGAQGAAAGTNLSLSNGMILSAAATAGNAQFAMIEMDEAGNVSVGRGAVKVGAASAANNGSVKVNPQMTTKNQYAMDAETSIGTTVDKSRTYVEGGTYPNGIDVKVQNIAPAIVSTSAVTGKYMQDLDLRVTAAKTGAPAATGSIVLETMNNISNNEITAANITAGLISASDFKATFTDAATGLQSTMQVAVASTADGTLTVTTTTDGTNGTAFTFTVGDLTQGDKVLAKQQAATGALTNATSSANITMDGLTVQVAAANLDDVKIHNVQLDNNGNVYNSTAHISLTDNTAGTLSFKTPDAKVATLDTRLAQITRFTNADGRMVLDNTQTLTLFANGNTVDMTLESCDTVGDFRDKLNQALLDLGLGSGDENIDKNLVRYVTEEEAQKSGNLAVAGTFVFQAGIAGDASEVQFIGDQGVINALSIAQIQEAQNAELDVTVTNAHNGEVIGKDRICDNVLRGVIDGIDVKISNPQLVTSYNSTTGKISFTPPADPITMDLHVVDNRTAVQIGANEGQTLDVSIGEMNTKALEIDDAYVTTFDASQKAITKFDQALAKVSGARATIGAQVNRLQYTMSNLAVSRQNLVASESRIRDLDVADESATFAKNQVLVNTAIAMLAQANALPQAALQLIG